MRNLSFVVLTIAVLSFSLAAQDYPRAEVFGGYSFDRIAPCGKSGSGCGFENNRGPLTTNYNGWNTSVTGYFRKSLGVTADFGGYYGTPKLANNAGPSHRSSVYTYMFGPVYAFRTEKVTIFVHALAGGISQGSFNYNALAWAFGGGLDLYSSPHVAIRAVQVDFMGNSVPTGNGSPALGFRLSGGVVFKF